MWLNLFLFAICKLMFTVHFLEISIAFVLNLYSLNVIKKIGTSELISSLNIRVNVNGRVPQIYILHSHFVQLAK